MFKRKPRTPAVPKAVKKSPVMLLLEQKLEYYPDPNRKQVIIDLIEEISRLK
jgi:hypothetical protein